MKAGSQFEGGSNSKCHWLWKYIECAINFKVLISPQRKLERLWGQAEKKVGVQGERAVFVRMGDLFPHHALRTKESLKKPPQELRTFVRKKKKYCNKAF